MTRTNFEALPPDAAAERHSLQSPFIAHEETAQAGLTLRPMQPLKIENTYLFEHLRAPDNAFSFDQLAIPNGWARHL